MIPILIIADRLRANSQVLFEKRSIFSVSSFKINLFIILWCRGDPSNKKIAYCILAFVFKIL